MTQKIKKYVAGAIAAAVFSSGWVFWFTSYPPKQVKPLAPLMVLAGTEISEVDRHCFGCHDTAVCDIETINLVNLAVRSCMMQGYGLKSCATFKDNAVRKHSSCMVNKPLDK